MAWVKGQSGNLGGSKPRPWADALRSALNQIDPETKKKKLLALADRMVAAALDGDIAAMREIGDRIEGKPAQAISHENADGSPISIVIATAIPIEAADHPVESVH